MIADFNSRSQPSKLGLILTTLRYVSITGRKIPLVSNVWKGTTASEGMCAAVKYALNLNMPHMLAVLSTTQPARILTHFMRLHKSNLVHLGSLGRLLPTRWASLVVREDERRVKPTQ